MLECTTFQDGGSNSLSHVKSELLVSYSKFAFEKMDLLMNPTALAAINNPSFPSVYKAIDTACAWKITAHLCQWRQQQLAPRHLEDHLGGRKVAQHTTLVAQPPTSWSTAAAHHHHP